MDLADQGERSRLTRALIIAGVCAAAGPLLLLSRNFDPQKVAWFPQCPIHAVTGLYCPGCGISRALHALLHGDVLAALAWNPWCVLLPLLVVLSLLSKERLTRAWVPKALLAAVLLFTVLRNIPGWPLTLLAPH